MNVELRGRIQNVLAAGGLVSIDAGFPDWSTVLSDNPFVVLYLDHGQTDALTPELVTRHFNLLMAFWQTKLDSMRGPSHDEIVRRYGGHLLSVVLVNSYPKRLRDAYARLETREGINAEKDRIRTERLRVGADAIATALDVMLANGVMDPAEAKALFASGRRAELTAEEVAEILQSALTKQGFRPDAPPKGATLSDRLQSVRWSDPTRDRDAEPEVVGQEAGRQAWQALGAGSPPAPSARQRSKSKILGAIIGTGVLVAAVVVWINHRDERSGINREVSLNFTSDRGFTEFDDKGGSLKYEDHAMVVRTKTAEDLLTFGPVAAFTSYWFDAEVTGAVKQGSSTNTWWGVTFGKTAPHSYYVFEISDGGSFALRQRSPAGWTDLVEPTASSRIRAGLNARNTLGIDVFGSSALLRINTQIVIGRPFSFSEPPSGEVGLLTRGPDGGDPAPAVVFYSVRGHPRQLTLFKRVVSRLQYVAYLLRQH